MLIVLVYLCCPIICLTFCIPCYDVCYGFHMDTMFGSSLPSAVCRKDHVLFTLFVFVCLWWCPAVCRRDHVLFTLFVFVCLWWCPAHVVLCLCLVFLCPVYPVLIIFPLLCSLTFMFLYFGYLQSTKFTMATLFVCRLKINIPCPSYIEKALLHLTGQMDDIFIHVHPYH